MSSVLNGVEMNSLNSMLFVSSKFYWRPMDATDIIRLVLSFKYICSKDIYDMSVQFLKKRICYCSYF